MFPFFLIFGVTFAVTAVLRPLLTKGRVLDVPNHRSSHSSPVPRGGGVSFAAVTIVAILWLYFRHAISGNLTLALVGSGMALGITGFLDDCFETPVWFRLIVQFLAAGWTMWWLGGVVPLHSISGSIEWRWGVQAIAICGLVWFINLFNFMDGIDGLAGMEAVAVCGLGAILLVLRVPGGYEQCAWVLASATGGFLIWNLPPAKLFMGDTGSGFLGVVLGILVLFSAKSQPIFFWAWLILFSSFIVDATVTLLRRLISGSHWSKGHRSHAYQHAAQRLGSHAKVTWAVLGINVFWLFPLAWVAVGHPSIAPFLALIAIIPLVFLAIHFDAGKVESSLVASTTTA